MTDNLHSARVEAACEAYRRPRRMLTNTSDGNHHDRMEAALAAADAVVTVEQIRDEIAGHPLGSGYYQTTLSIYEAQEIAESVHALLTGEEA